MAENIPEMNEIIEDLSVEQKGPAMRRLITQGFKRLTQTVNNAVSTQITDYDAFFKTPRLGPLENGKFSIEEGGFFSDITENPGQPAPANNRCRTRAISLSSATVIRLPQRPGR